MLFNHFFGNLQSKKRILFHVIIASIVSFLLLGCNSPEVLRISQIASQEYRADEAVSVLYYQGDGIVKYLTRSGDSGTINLKEKTLNRDTTTKYRQHGMPYQYQSVVISGDTLDLVSYRDNGIHLGDKALTIPEKGIHYSAYKSILVGEKNDTILSCTSNGLYLFSMNGTGHEEGCRLKLWTEEESQSIDSLRFVDLIQVSEYVCYAVGHLGIAKIDLQLSNNSAVLELQEPGFFLLRRSEEGGLIAYSENGYSYQQQKEARWSKKNKRTSGATFSFVEKDKCDSSFHREWLFGFDRPIEIWDGQQLLARVYDEGFTGMHVLNSRMRYNVVEAADDDLNDYGLVVARGVQVFVIPKKIPLQKSEPVFSACLGKNNWLYFKAGVYYDVDGVESAIFRAKIKRNGTISKRHHYLRQVPFHSDLIGVKDKQQLIVYDRDSNYVLNLAFSKANNSVPTNRSLVSARVFNGEILYQTQDAIIAYHTTLNHTVAGINDPGDYYPQAFLPIPIKGREIPLIAVSSLHKGIIIFQISKSDKKGKENKDTLDTITVKNNHLLFDDPVMTMIMEASIDKPDKPDKPDTIYLYTQKNRIRALTLEMDGTWTVSLDSLAMPKKILDEIAEDGKGNLYGINYFSRGWLRLNHQEDCTFQDQYVKINGLCSTGESIVFACEEGIFTNKDREPVPVRLRWWGNIKLHADPRLRDILNALPMIAFILFAVLSLTVIIFYLKWRDAKNNEERNNNVKDNSKQLDVQSEIQVSNQSGKKVQEELIKNESIQPKTYRLEQAELQKIERAESEEKKEKYCWPTDEELKCYNKSFADGEFFKESIFGDAAEVNASDVEKLFNVLVDLHILDNDLKTKLILLARYSGRIIPNLKLNPIKWTMTSKDRVNALGYVLKKTANADFKNGINFFYFDIAGKQEKPDRGKVAQGGNQWAKPERKKRTTLEKRIIELVDKYEKPD